MNMKQAQYVSQELVDPKIPHQNQRMIELKLALYHNKKAQDELKNIRDMIKKRMKILEEYISSYKIKLEHPPFTALMSYLKFQRNFPNSFREMLRVSSIENPFNTKQEEQCQFMNKLIHSKPQKKKKEIHVKDLPENPNAEDFIELSKDTQFKNGIQFYRTWFESKRVKGPKKLFTMAEDNIIHEKHIRYGQNWEKICSFLQTRSFDQIYYEYHNRINPDLVGGRWSIRHTLMLLILIQHYGAKKWSMISNKMKIKSQLQVRERYCTLLDPTIGKDIWNYQLQKKLLEIAEDYGFCWKKISQLQIFKGKSDNAIWRRYRNLMIRFSQQEINHILHPNSNNRNLAQKIIKQKRIHDSRKRSSNNKSQPPIYFKQYQALNTFSPKSITPIHRNQSHQILPIIVIGNRHSSEGQHNHIEHEGDSQFFPTGRIYESEIYQQSGEERQ